MQTIREEIKRERDEDELCHIICPMEDIMEEIERNLRPTPQHQQSNTKQSRPMVML